MSPYGTLRVAASYTSIPNEKTSAFLLALRPRSVSGADHCGAIIEHVTMAVSCLATDRPKSATLATPWWSSSTLGDLRLRWSTGGEKACR